MYIDPNVGGMLFQILAVIATVFTGLVFAFSRQIRSGIARIRRLLFGHKDTGPVKNKKPQ